jgi:ribosomal-protein-alanine N-acetyltransferase
MLIRNMTAEDIPAVVEIEKECFSLPWSEKSFAESIVREDTIFLVCEEKDGAIMGYIGMYLSFDEASITNVAVASQFRKRGCGKQLVIAAKTAAKEAGAESIFLEVRVSNVPAISLYKKQGFENLGIRKKFYEHPVEDAIIMKVGI